MASHIEFGQFRSGILPLRIETGRWKNESIEGRVCLVCEENIVKDEYPVCM